MESFEVDDAGLRGMVALMKMSESWLRCRVLGVGCSDWLARVSDDDDGVESCVENDMSSGSSIWRFARGDCGKPTGDVCVDSDILCAFEVAEGRSSLRLERNTLSCADICNVPNNLFSRYKAYIKERMFV